VEDLEVCLRVLFAESRIPYTQWYYCHVAPWGVLAKVPFVVRGGATHTHTHTHTEYADIQTCARIYTHTHTQNAWFAAAVCVRVCVCVCLQMLLLLLLPLLFTALGDTAELYFSPTMAIVSQTIPGMRPRFAGGGTYNLQHARANRL
jgi:hypothetical protein